MRSRAGPDTVPRDAGPSLGEDPRGRHGGGGRGRSRAVRRAVRRARGRRTWCSSPRHRSRRPRATGHRAGSRPRSPPTTASSCTSRDTERAGRGLVRRSAAEILVREAPDRVRDLQDARRRASTPTASARLALGLEGGHSVRRVVHAGGSATGRRVVRQLSALAAEEPRITVFEGARAQALWRSRGALPRARLRRRPRDRRARRGDRHGRRRGAVGANDQPAGLAGDRHAARARRRRGARRPRAAAVPPDRGDRRRRARGVPRDRGDPRRGRDAARRRAASGSSTSSRRAMRSRARSRAAWRLPASDRSGWTCARSTRPSFPNVVVSAARSGPRSDARADPGRAGRALHDGRDRHRPRRALDARPGSTRSASPRAPACTAPTGSRRTRSASASCSPAARSPTRSHARLASTCAARAGAGARGAARAARAAGRRAPRHARRCGATRASCARRPGPERAAGTIPTRSRALIARCALARTESRGAHLRAEYPERDAAFDLRHVLVARRAADRLGDLALRRRANAHGTSGAVHKKFAL